MVRVFIPEKLANITNQGLFPPQQAGCSPLTSTLQVMSLLSGVYFYFDLLWADLLFDK